MAPDPKRVQYGHGELNAVTDKCAESFRNAPRAHQQNAQHIAQNRRGDENAQQRQHVAPRRIDSVFAFSPHVISRMIRRNSQFRACLISVLAPERRDHHGLDRVHPVLGLIENDRGIRLEDLLGHFHFGQTEFSNMSLPTLVSRL